MNEASYVAAKRGAESISLTALLAYALTTPPQLVHKCDALYVPQGLAEHNRVEHTLRMWESGVANHLLVAGSYSREPGSLNTSVDMLMECFGLRRTTNVHTQAEGINTPAQTKWVAATCKQQGITSIAVVAPAYHMLRQLLVLHASLEAVGLLIPVIPVPLHVPPTSLTRGTLAGEGNLTAISMVDGELDRIAKYQPLGGVASVDEYVRYLEWLWQHPLVKNASY